MLANIFKKFLRQPESLNPETVLPLVLPPVSLQRLWADYSEYEGLYLRNFPGGIQRIGLRKLRVINRAKDLSGLEVLPKKT